VSEAEPKPEPNIIEQIAEELIEGIPYKPEPKLRGGPYSLNYSGLDYNEYKHANKKSISVRDWSFAPKRYGNPNYTRKVMNDWKWRMGQWIRGNPEQIKDDEKAEATDK
jgi:hypothetical protein